MTRTRLRPLVIYITTMGMELCCLYLALLWVRELFGLGYIAFTVILTIYPGTLFLRLLLSKSSPTPGGDRLPTVLIGTAVTALVAGLAIWGGLAGQPVLGQQDVLGLGLQLVFIAIAWWLGFSLARGGINYQHICFRFQRGILSLLVLSILIGQVLWPVVGFLTLAVFTLPLARWENSASTSRATLKPLPFGKIILGSMVVLLLVTGLFFVFSSGVTENVVGWISEVDDSVDSFLKSVVSDAGEGGGFQFSCSMQVPEITVPIPEVTPPDTPAVLSPARSWLVMLITGISILAIILLTLLTIRKRKTRRLLTRPETLADIETTQVSVSLLGELTAFSKRAGQWLWWAMLSLLLRLRSGTWPVTVHRGEPGLSVRVFYRRLLDWAAEQGLPREQSQTPLEYLKVLCQKFPGEDKELVVITGIYLQVRYGQRPVSDAEVEAVGQAWQKIELSP